MIAQPWPKAGTIAAAIAGSVAEVVKLRGGGACRGVRSACPWVLFLLQQEHPTLGTIHCVVCHRCEDGESMPDSPTSQGLNGAGEPLFAHGTHNHAIFVLTWLNAFVRKHADCKERVENQ